MTGIAAYFTGRRFAARIRQKAFGVDRGKEAPPVLPVYRIEEDMRKPLLLQLGRDAGASIGRVPVANDMNLHDGLDGQRGKIGLWKGAEPPTGRRSYGATRGRRCVLRFLRASDGNG